MVDIGVLDGGGRLPLGGKGWVSEIFLVLLLLFFLPFDIERV